MDSTTEISSMAVMLRTVLERYVEGRMLRTVVQRFVVGP
jgi:hypothetical protein